jgi:hypothetical protein
MMKDKRNRGDFPFANGGSRGICFFALLENSRFTPFSKRDLRNRAQLVFSSVPTWNAGGGSWNC